MWLSWKGSGIRIHRMPGATSMLAAPSGGSGHGWTRPGAGAASGCSGSGDMLLTVPRPPSPEAKR
jgi:hypothetical protein